VDWCVETFESTPGLQDTPGVDSNVSTHQSTTEQFLYTSNMIVYIVDYNWCVETFESTPGVSCNVKPRLNLFEGNFISIDSTSINLEYQKYAKLKTYDDVKIMNRLNIDVESIEIKFPSNKFNLGFTLQDYF
jgi:hypothetical protein